MDIEQNFEMHEEDTKPYREVVTALQDLTEYRRNVLEPAKESHEEVTDRIDELEKQIQAIEESIETLLPTPEARSLLHADVDEIESDQVADSIPAAVDAEEAKRLLEALRGELMKKERKKSQLDNIDSIEKEAYKDKQEKESVEYEKIKEIHAKLREQITNKPNVSD